MPLIAISSLHSDAQYHVVGVSAGTFVSITHLDDKFVTAPSDVHGQPLSNVQTLHSFRVTQRSLSIFDNNDFVTVFLGVHVEPRCTIVLQEKIAFDVQNYSLIGLRQIIVSECVKVKKMGSNQSLCVG